MSDTRWPHFTEAELTCHCGCGRQEMVPEFMDLIQAIRADLGFPFIVTSAFRCEAYDRSLGGAGCHPLGMAIDIGVSGYRAWALVQAALKSHAMKYKELSPYIITGIGIKQHGHYQGRFIHLDALPVLDPRHPRPLIWTYK